jgi:tetratricopeptide (TPR) repeat protein
MKKIPKKEKAKSKKAPGKQYLMHKDYGKIPLIDVPYIGTDGRTHATHVLDYNYRPTVIPHGAVMGDPNRQVLYGSFPKYYFEDIEKTCIQCGNDFIFSAKEQKHWYEDLQFIIYAECLKCMACRRLKKSKVALNDQLSSAQKYYNQYPNEPYAMLNLAEAICMYYKAYHSGRITLAISLARKARKTNAMFVEGLYWEAMALMLSGNNKKAIPLFKEFIEKAPSGKRCVALIKNAKTFI